MVWTPPAIVLVADPDPKHLESQALIIRQLGCDQVLKANVGTSAWAQIKAAKVELVVSSWDLPELTGLVLLKVVRADPDLLELPFLLVADHMGRSEVLDARGSGVTDILLRPFTPEKFKAKVRSVLEGEQDPKILESKRMYNLGLEFMKQGQYDEALDSFKKSLAVNESAEIYYNLGYIKTAQGRYEEALMAFRRATQIDQAYAKAYQKMGELYKLMGRGREAEECLNQAADLFMDRKMDREAEEAYRQVLEVSPNSPNIFNSLGIVYRRQGRFHDAIRMYRKAIKVTPRDEHIHYNLGRVYMTVRQFREAAVHLQMAADINPDFAEARNLLKSLQMGDALG